jgi:putative salt-induced outer membrane protein
VRYTSVLAAACLALILPGVALADEKGAQDREAQDGDQEGAPLMPPPIKAMLDAALESGNEGEVATIVKYARIADPASADVVLAIAEHWRADRAAGRDATLRQASFLDLWKGQAQVGGYLTTGNSSTLGVTGSLNLVREGLNWRHKFVAQADYQENLGIATREHYLASYEPNYKFSDRAYVYGSGQYESDRFLGYFDRFSTSAGIGYSAIKRPRLSLDVELGPAYRHTSFTDRTVQDSLAGRGSLNIAWKLTNGLSVTQIASAYLQKFNSTVSSATALNAKLIGPLSAQISYNVQYESEPPVGSVSTDTTSRASLVYSF